MKKIAILMMSMLFLAQGGFAKDGDGGYAGAFLRMGIGARAKAMGDAFSAVPEDAFSGIYNPALLPHLAGRQAAISFAFLPLDRKLDYVGYAQPLNPKRAEGEDEAPLRAGFALAWIHAGVNNIDGRDLAGNHTQDYSFSENAFYLSFALSPHKKFSLGVSGKVLYSRIPDISSDNSALTSRGFGLDIGAYFSPIPDLNMAVVLRDNMSKYTWNTEKVWERGTSVTNPFPKVMRAAVAYRPPMRWLLVSAEVEDSKEQNPRYHVGAEAHMPEIGALRVGLDDGRPTFGLGFGFKVLGTLLDLNYAYVAPDEAPGADHIFSWHFGF
jgi:hypothetical protein